MKHLLILVAFFSTITLKAQTAKKASNGGNSSKGSTVTSEKPKPAASPKAKQKPAVRQSLSEFRKIHWGSRLDSILIDGAKPTFVKTSEFGKSENNAYYIENDDLTIGTVPLQKILYVFTADSALSRVVLTGDKKKFGEMKYIIAYKFGEPTIVDKADGYDCVWEMDDCKIRLSFENDLNIFTVNFFSDYEISNSKRENRSVDDF